MPKDNVIEYIQTHNEATEADAGNPIPIEENRGQYGVFEYEMDAGTATGQFWFFNQILGWCKGESFELQVGKFSEIFFTNGRTWGITLTAVSGATITGYAAFLRDERDR